MSSGGGGEAQLPFGADPASSVPVCRSSGPPTGSRPLTPTLYRLPSTSTVAVVYRSSVPVLPLISLGKVAPAIRTFPPSCNPSVGGARVCPGFPAQIRQHVPGPRPPDVSTARTVARTRRT